MAAAERGAMKPSYRPLPHSDSTTLAWWLAGLAWDGLGWERLAGKKSRRENTPSLRYHIYIGAYTFTGHPLHPLHNSS